MFGVGVGPGDPELMTLRAVRCVREAPVVAYVSANGRPSIARQIAAAHLGAGQKEIKVTLPMHPAPEIAAAAYDEGAARISTELEQGRDVAVLCEGDPLFYGSFNRVFERLGAHYPTEIIPGVSSPTAAAAAARRPLIAGAGAFVVLPATMPRERLLTQLGDADAAVIMKLGRHLEKVKGVLQELGLTKQTVYVEKASTQDEKVVPLPELTRIEAPYFSLLIVTRRDR
jgi:precorrin-2/cobalt-factor-2 C20-methyltransferase